MMALRRIHHRQRRSTQESRDRGGTDRGQQRYKRIIISLSAVLSPPMAPYSSKGSGNTTGTKIPKKTLLYTPHGPEGTVMMFPRPSIMVTDSQVRILDIQKTMHWIQPKIHSISGA